MKPRHKRLSSSPLIDPAVTCLVLIAPGRRDLATMKRSNLSSLRRNVAAVVAAADIAGVPIFVSSPLSSERKHGFVGRLRMPPRHREFPCAGYGLPWLTPAFAKALAEEDKTTLVLGGFWLEHQVLATVLHALAESYDVYVLADATPAQNPIVAPMSHQRLMQAGATLVVSSQVIHEWYLETTDQTARASLSSLLAPFTGP
jgi:hypothetical protein